MEQQNEFLPYNFEQDDDEPDRTQILPNQEDIEESPEIGIIKELKTDDVLVKIRMELRGYEFIQEKKKWVKIREPFMNERGINAYMNVLSSVTRVVTLSNYKEEDIPKRVLYVCEKVIPVLHINYKDFGIKNKSDLPLLDVQLFNLTEAALNKAKAAGDRAVIRGTYTFDDRGVRYPQGMPPFHQKNKLNPFAKE